MTVLFCDIVGSTKLTERLEADDWLEALRGYRSRCCEAIGRHGGFVARFIGDGIFAYFGHPVAHESDAERAVRAALRDRGADGHHPAAGRLAPPGAPRPRHGDGGGRGSLDRGRARWEYGRGRHAEPRLAAAGRRAARRGRRLGDDLPPDRGVLPLRAARPAHARGNRRAGHGVARAGRAPSSSAGSARAPARSCRHRWSPGTPSLLACATRGTEPGGATVNSRSWSARPGIGKSRLVEAFAATVRGEDALQIAFSASPYGAGTPLGPLLQRLHRITGRGRLRFSASRVRRRLARAPAPASPRSASAPRRCSPGWYGGLVRVGGRSRVAGPAQVGNLRHAAAAIRHAGRRGAAAADHGRRPALARPLVPRTPGAARRAQARTPRADRRHDASG